jgi:hypothetical protein
MIGGPLPAKNANNCAAQKWALERALANYMDAEKACNAAIDAMADAYGELSTAANDAKTKNDELRIAYKKSVAAWDAYYGCEWTAANNNCKAELDATRKLTAEYDAAVTASRIADQALVAAQMVLDNAKSNYRAKAMAEAEAKEALDKARADLAKCLNRPRMR